MAGQDEQITQALEAQEEALEAMGEDAGLPEEEAGPRQLSFSFAKRNQVLLETNETPAVLYFTENTPFDVFAEVRRFYGEPFVPKTIPANEFESLLTSAFQRDSSAAKQLMEDLGNESDLFALAEDLPDTEDLLDSEDDAPIIKLINAMLGEAIKEGASDIHIETFENQLVVRFRVDGVLREILRPNRKLSSMLVSRIKVMAKLDIAEKRVPQDGRITLRIAGRAVDVRVSTMPSSHGERVVLRLLDKNNARLNLEDLGMTLQNRNHFSSLIRKPHGIILVTGPTGSGKSTTLAAMIDYINDTRYEHVLTIEDPIEFVHDSKKCLVNQREVHRDTLGFNEALRSALREDPDIILVGELRDLETIRLALTAAETGHLVFGTLHTTSAAKTIDRVVDVFPAAEKAMVRSMLSESLQAVISQTLLKKQGGGRVAAHEIMIGTPAIRNLIREDKVAQMYSAIQTGASLGMQTLDQCLGDLVRKGHVSIELAREKAKNPDAIK